MQSVIRSIFVLFLLGFFTVASAQLPPEVMVDKHLIQAEQLIGAKDYAGAFKEMEKIVALQKEHNLTLPDGFLFKYAQVAFSVGSFQIAIDAVNKYLAVGRKGEFYKEALALLIKFEKELEELKITPEKTCTGKPEGSSCWMALTNQPECYVWNSNLWDAETRTWSGDCLAGFAQGEGTIIKNFTTSSGQKSRIEAMGHLQNGKKHGRWVERDSTGKVVTEGSFVDGKRHGEWVSNTSDGVWKASYVDGKRHGRWVSRDSNGKVVSEGSFVDGKKHGEWVFNISDAVWKGPYVDDKKHGRWVERDSNGTVVSEDEGPYVNGTKQGRWVERTYYPRYMWVEEGPYVDGKKHGEWVWNTSDTVWKGPYVDGKMQGRWVERDSNGKFLSKGSYVDGKRHGRWVEGEVNGPVSEGSYVDGTKQGRWVIRYPSGRVEEGPFVDGKMQGEWTVTYPSGRVRQRSY